MRRPSILSQGRILVVEKVVGLFSDEHGATDATWYTIGISGSERWILTENTYTMCGKGTGTVSVGLNLGLISSRTGI